MLSYETPQMCQFAKINAKMTKIQLNLFYYSAYFYYYLQVLLHFLILFMNLTILF